MELQHMTFHLDAALSTFKEDSRISPNFTRPLTVNTHLQQEQNCRSNFPENSYTSQDTQTDLYTAKTWSYSAFLFSCVLYSWASAAGLVWTAGSELGFSTWSSTCAGGSLYRRASARSCPTCTWAGWPCTWPSPARGRCWWSCRTPTRAVRCSPNTAASPRTRARKMSAGRMKSGTPARVRMTPRCCWTPAPERASDTRWPCSTWTSTRPRRNVLIWTAFIWVSGLNLSSLRFTIISLNERTVMLGYLSKLKIIFKACGNRYTLQNPIN